MQFLKELIKKNFQGFIFFYSQLGYKIYFVIVIGLLVGILDSLGLAMFLPLLQLVSGEGQAGGEQLGKLQIIVNILENLGWNLDLKTILLILSLFFTSKAIISYLGNVYQVNIRQFFLRRLRLSLTDNLNLISFKEFVLWDIGRIQNTFTTETERITNAIVHYFRALNLLVLLIVYLSFAFTMDAQFAFFVTIGGLLTHLISHYVFNLSIKASRQVTTQNHTFQGLILQYLNNYKYLKSTSGIVTYGKKIKRSILDIENNYRKLGIYSAFLISTREPFIILVISGVILIQVEVFGAELGSILISLLFFYRSLGALNQLQRSWNLYIKFSGSIENMVSFQHELALKREVRNEDVPFESFNESIQVQNLSFSFGEHKILENISFNISKNEAIAFVGESGSGKTTLVNLISGLFSPDQGEIFIDRKRIQNIVIQNYHQRIGIVTQEPTIFNDTIYNNVTFWDEDNSENREEFWTALKQTAMYSFVKGLPQKEKTMLGNNGINLSGGQRQRLSIARELYKNIEILIMDEATSALDSETEKIIQNNIDALKGKITLLIVAHRLSTIKNTDKVLLLEKGKILNFLPFDELVAKNEKFRKMVELQKV